MMTMRDSFASYGGSEDDEAAELISVAAE